MGELLKTQQTIVETQHIMNHEINHLHYVYTIRIITNLPTFMNISCCLTIVFFFHMPTCEDGYSKFQNFKSKFSVRFMSYFLGRYFSKNVLSNPINE